MISFLLLLLFDFFDSQILSLLFFIGYNREKTCERGISDKEKEGRYKEIGRQDLESKASIKRQLACYNGLEHWEISEEGMLAPAV